MKEEGSITTDRSGEGGSITTELVKEEGSITTDRSGEGGRLYWAIQQSWFARVNALCNLSRKKSREVTAHFRADF